MDSIWAAKATLKMMPMMMPMNTLTRTLTNTSQKTITLSMVVGVPTARRILYISSYSRHLLRVQRKSRRTDRMFITPESSVMNFSRQVSRMAKLLETKEISLRVVCSGDRARMFEATSFTSSWRCLPLISSFTYFMGSQFEFTRLYRQLACCSLRKALLQRISYPGVVFNTCVTLALMQRLECSVSFLTQSLQRYPGLEPSFFLIDDDIARLITCSCLGKPSSYLTLDISSIEDIFSWSRTVMVSSGLYLPTLQLPLQMVSKPLRTPLGSLVQFQGSRQASGTQYSMQLEFMQLGVKTLKSQLIFLSGLRLSTKLMEMPFLAMLALIQEYSILSRCLSRQALTLLVLNPSSQFSRTKSDPSPLLMNDWMSLISMLIPEVKNSTKANISARLRLILRFVNLLAFRFLRVTDRMLLRCLEAQASRPRMAASRQLCRTVHSMIDPRIMKKKIELNSRVCISALLQSTALGMKQQLVNPQQISITATSIISDSRPKVAILITLILTTSKVLLKGFMDSTMLLAQILIICRTQVTWLNSSTHTNRKTASPMLWEMGSQCSCEQITWIRMYFSSINIRVLTKLTISQQQKWPTFLIICHLYFRSSLRGSRSVKCFWICGCLPFRIALGLEEPD